MLTLLRAAVVAALLLLVAPSSAAEEIVIPGSGNPEYVLRRLAESFNASQNEHRVTIPTSTGTAGALRDVGEGAAVLGRVGRNLKEAERTGGMTYVPLGRDAVVFVAGAGVGLRNVTTAQMIDVFGGRVSDWRDIGGKAGPIRAIGRESSDAARAALEKVLKPFAAVQYGESVKIVHLDPQLIELLDRFPTSVGYLNRSGLHAATTKVIPLALDSVEASLENLASGRYPVWIEFGLVYRAGKLTDGARAFLAYLATPAATRILQEHGVYPVGSAFAKAS